VIGDLRDRGRLAGIERANQKLGTFVDQLFGLRAGDLDVRLGVGIHDLKAGLTDILENAGCDIDAALAILADEGLNARTRQQHTDFQRRALRPADVERRGTGNDACGAETGGEGAARDARKTRLDGHFVTPPLMVR
jgi:hypothetical protein